jgi:hypothetical protein
VVGLLIAFFSDQGKTGFKWAMALVALWLVTACILAAVQ